MFLDLKVVCLGWNRVERVMKRFEVHLDVWDLDWVDHQILVVLLVDDGEELDLGS